MQKVAKLTLGLNFQDKGFVKQQIQKSSLSSYHSKIEILYNSLQSQIENNSGNQQGSHQVDSSDAACYRKDSESRGRD